MAAVLCWRGAAALAGATALLQAVPDGGPLGLGDAGRLRAGAEVAGGHGAAAAAALVGARAGFAAGLQLEALVGVAAGPGDAGSAFGVGLAASWLASWRSSFFRFFLLGGVEEGGARARQQPGAQALIGARPEGAPGAWRDLRPCVPVCDERGGH